MNAESYQLSSFFVMTSKADVKCKIADSKYCSLFWEEYVFAKNCSFNRSEHEFIILSGFLDNFRIVEKVLAHLW